MARIQLNILDSLKQYGGGGNSMEVSNAITQLNSELMDITSLYEHFADKFDLAECKLAIVHCAGHYDPTLIESLWRDIVDNGMYDIIGDNIMDKGHIGTSHFVHYGEVVLFLMYSGPSE